MRKSLPLVGKSRLLHILHFKLHTARQLMKERRNVRPIVPQKATHVPIFFICDRCLLFGIPHIQVSSTPDNFLLQHSISCTRTFKTPVTRIRFHLKTQLYRCGFTSCLYGNDETIIKTQTFDHAIQSGSL